MLNAPSSSVCVCVLLCCERILECLRQGTLSQLFCSIGTRLSWCSMFELFMLDFQVTRRAKNSTRARTTARASPTTRERLASLSANAYLASLVWTSSQLKIWPLKCIKDIKFKCCCVRVLQECIVRSTEMSVSRIRAETEECASIWWTLTSATVPTQVDTSTVFTSLMFNTFCDLSNSRHVCRLRRWDVQC